jgi:hypothetical protein
VISSFYCGFHRRLMFYQRNNWITVLLTSFSTPTTTQVIIEQSECCMCQQNGGMLTAASSASVHGLCFRRARGGGLNSPAMALDVGTSVACARARPSSRGRLLLFSFSRRRLTFSLLTTNTQCVHIMIVAYGTKARSTHRC